MTFQPGRQRPGMKRQLNRIRRDDRRQTGMDINIIYALLTIIFGLLAAGSATVIIRSGL